MKEIMPSQSGLGPQRMPSIQDKFPTEVLLHIFDLAAGDLDPKREPLASIDDGTCSTWSKSLRVKKVLVRVCKSWRGITLPFLYRRIYLLRVGQLCALVRTLEESTKLGGYGPLVRDIEAHFYVHPSWEGVYFKNIVRLMEICISLQELSWCIVWEKTDPKNTGRNQGWPKSAECSTINVLLLAQPMLLPTFASLRKLIISFSEPSNYLTVQRKEFFSDKVPIALDNLEDLSCDAPDASELSFVSFSFVMPMIKRLEIVISSTWQRDNVVNSTIFEMLDSHGANLSSLELTTPAPFGQTRKNVGDILRRTPNLQSLRYSSLRFFPINTTSNTATSFPNLQTLELVTPKECFPPVTVFYNEVSDEFTEREDLEQFLVMASSRRVFPNLQTIRLYEWKMPNVRIDGVIAPSDHSGAYPHFLTWTRKLRNMGIALLGVDGEPIVPENPDPERWTGRDLVEDNGNWEVEEDVHTDHEDLSFDSDRVSDRSGDESSEYSWSDSESDGGDWSSDEEGSVSEVGSTEALEIYETTLLVCDLYLLWFALRYTLMLLCRMRKWPRAWRTTRT